VSDHRVIIKDEITGKSLELPVIQGTEGEPTVVIKALPSTLGYFTYDPGFTATASCTSSITFIDGGKGILRYRGYPIEQLAENSDFLEVAYLLLNGELPTGDELTEFNHDITNHTMIHEKLNTFISGFHYDAHPMAMMAGVVGSLSAFYHDKMDMENPEHRMLAAKRMIAKMPTIAAACYRHHMGWPTAFPKNSLNFTERFLQMMFSVRANEAVLEMLDEIGDVSRVDQYIARAKDRDDPFRLMGFGHRVYKNYDPRASIIRKAAYEVLEELGASDPLMDLAMELERIALEDEYFVSKKLYPNVDFYSGIIYKALGIPRSMFTVMFAIARTVGWVSQWLEQEDTPTPIGRPRQVYNGPGERQYIPVESR